MNNLSINLYLNDENEVRFEVSVNLRFLRIGGRSPHTEKITGQGETLEKAIDDLKLAIGITIDKEQGWSCGITRFEIEGGKINE